MSECEKAIATMVLLAMAIVIVRWFYWLINRLLRHQQAVLRVIHVSADLYGKLSPQQQNSPSGVKFLQLSGFLPCWVGLLVCRTKYFRKHRALYMDALGVKNEV